MNFCKYFKISILSLNKNTIFMAVLIGLMCISKPTLAGQTVLSERDGASKPAVLFSVWGRHLDRPFIQQLLKAGMAVDAISHHELTWERLRQFNVLVMLGMPTPGEVKRSPFGSPARGPNLDQTLTLLDRFLNAGGGVMLVMGHLERDSFLAARQALAHWDAGLPLHLLEVPPVSVATHPRLRAYPYFRTEAILTSSPLTEGVRSVWYPMFQSFVEPQNLSSGSIWVGDDWQVLLSAGPDTRTLPVDQSRRPTEMQIELGEHDRNMVADPPLFAVREVGAGRMALFRSKLVYHVGSGSSWLHDGAMLNKGLNGKPSDFGRLIQNTLTWLSQPSLAGKTLGGADIPSDRWVPTNHRNDAQQKHDSSWIAVQGPPATLPLHRGVIGARTALSGGHGSVADYARAARELDVDFVIFLEDLTQLTTGELDQLTAQCQAQSSEDLVLIAGYRAVTNLGNSIFFFGQKPLYPNQTVLGPNGTFLLQGLDTDGQFTNSASSLHFVFDHLKNAPKREGNSVGYFDFTGPQKSGGLGVHDLRAFSMVGVRLYRDGKLIEDVTDQYLTTNQGTMSGTPVAISLIDSPEAMHKAVRANQSLTYATAHRPSSLWNDALRWNHTYISFNAFPSTGPMIEHWPVTVRQVPFGGEAFCTPYNYYRAPLRLRSDVGLRTVELFDGQTLVRRYRPDGKKQFHRDIHLSSHLQQNISVIATDVNGGRAVSFPLRTWKPGTSASVRFCADHVNDCARMRLARGPFWPMPRVTPELSDAGQAWDGGPTAKRELFDLGNLMPSVVAGKVSQSGRPYSIPRLIFSDERVYQGYVHSDRRLAFENPHAHAWTGYGPIKPSELFGAEVYVTEFDPYAVGVKPEGWMGVAMESGIRSVLWEQALTFKQALKNPNIQWARKTLNAMDGVTALVLVGQGRTLLHAREFSPLKRGEASRKYDIPAGGWIGMVSRQLSNAALLINRGSTIRLHLYGNRMELSLSPQDTPAQVQKGDRVSTEWLMMAWPLDMPLVDSADVQRIIGYLYTPEGLELISGKRVAEQTFGGLLELRATQGHVELVLPKPTEGKQLSLPVRVSNLNRRWAAWLHQREGYVGKGYYGGSVDRVRPLGIDERGRVYLPIDVSMARNTRAVVGHPVIADERGAELFIQCVATQANDRGIPTAWQVSVNNPLSEPVTTSIRQAMAVPGLSLSPQTLTIGPGEEVILAGD